MRDDRYGIIKPKFDEGKIKRFNDLISIVPKTRWAADIRKGSNGINKVVAEPESFKVFELIRIGRLCDLTLYDLLIIAGTDHKMPKTKVVDKRYGNVYTMFKAGKIKLVEDIFRYIPKSILASDIKMKSNRLSKLIHKVEDFSVKEIILIGSLFHMSKEQIYLTIVATYQEQNQSKRRNS